jgi:hypothetical protein
MNLQVKRVYGLPERTDGCRILVDRMWPRGLTKQKASSPSIYEVSDRFFSIRWRKRTAMRHRKTRILIWRASAGDCIISAMPVAHPSIACPSEGPRHTLPG